jgi:hypothetical protein
MLLKCILFIYIIIFMFFHKNWDHIAESPRFIYNTNYDYINKGNKFYMYPLWLRHRTVKFLFLSDCISKFIQQFSLKRAFVLYLSSVLKSRFLNIYVSNYNSIWINIDSILSKIKLLQFKNKNIFFFKELRKKNIFISLYVFYINFIFYKLSKLKCLLKRYNDKRIYLYFYFRINNFFSILINSVNIFFFTFIQIIKKSLFNYNLLFFLIIFLFLSL